MAENSKPPAFPNCGICGHPGGVNISSMPVAQAVALTTAAGQQDLERCCIHCVQRICHDHTPATPRDTWIVLHDALYHAKHNPDVDAPGVERKFINKGEKSKGDGVHRLRCAGLEEGKEGKEALCNAWRRVVQNNANGLWSYSDSGEHTCTILPPTKRKTVAPEIKSAVAAMVKKRMVRFPTSKHNYTTYNNNLKGALP